MGTVLAILSIIVAILLVIVPSYFKKWNEKPNIDLEFIPSPSHSTPLGYSNKNIFNEKFEIDINDAIKIFELEYNYKIKLRNNSNSVAYYPKIKVLNNISFAKIDKLNPLVPISNKDDITLKVSYIKIEECKGHERTNVGGIAKELENLKIQIEFKNNAGVTFYKLFDLTDKINPNKFLKKPIE